MNRPIKLLCLLVPFGLGACQTDNKEGEPQLLKESNEWTEEGVAEETSELAYNFGDNRKDYDDVVITEGVSEGTSDAAISNPDRSFLSESPNAVKLNATSNSMRSKPMLIQKVSMALRVDNLAESRVKLDSILNRYQAYLAHEHYNEEANEKGYEFVIRVPTQNLESLLKGTKGMEGEMRSFARNSEDVKAQYIDQETRLATKRRVLERYEAILGRAGKISEVLEAEREIRKLIEEIEATEGRLKYLREQSSYATVQMKLFQWVEMTPLSTQSSFSDKVTGAFKSGGNTVLALVIFFIQIWPLLLLIPIFILAWRKRFVKTAG